MNFYGRVERCVKQQLLIRIAFHPVLLSARALSLLEGAGLILAEQRPHREVAVGIQQLQAPDIDGVGYVGIAFGKISTLPGDTAAAGAALASIFDVGGKAIYGLL